MEVYKITTESKNILNVRAINMIDAITIIQKKLPNMNIISVELIGILIE